MTPQELRHAVEQMNMSQDMQERILLRSLKAGKEAPMRKKKRWKRAAIAAVAAVMVLTVTAVAASRSQVFVHWSDDAYTYENITEAQKAFEAAGSTLILPETLLDYTFQGAYTNYQMTAETEDGTTFSFSDGTEQEGVSVDYENNDATLTLTAAPAPEGEETGQTGETQTLPITTEVTTITGELVVEWQTENQAELYTLPYVYREVPEVVVVEKGVAEPEAESAMEGPAEDTVKTLQWTVDGMRYTLSQTKGELTREDLTAMAQALMEQQ